MPVIPDVYVIANDMIMITYMSMNKYAGHGPHIEDGHQLDIGLHIRNNRMNMNETEIVSKASGR